MRLQWANRGGGDNGIRVSRINGYSPQVVMLQAVDDGLPGVAAIVGFGKAAFGHNHVGFKWWPGEAHKHAELNAITTRGLVQAARRELMHCQRMPIFLRSGIVV